MRASSSHLALRYDLTRRLAPPRYEPLESARADVRLVQSLGQVWREEAERREAVGLPRNAAADSTPRSAAARRQRLPPPPKKVHGSY